MLITTRRSMFRRVLRSGLSLDTATPDAEVHRVTAPGSPSVTYLVNHYPKINVSAGTDGAIVLGCVVRFDPNPNNLTQVYRPASQERIAHCCFDPTVVYHIRGCGGGTPATDWIWRNAIMTAGTSSTVTGLSGFMLDEGTGTAPTNDASNTLLIVGVATMPDNEFGDNVIWEVMLNTRFLAAGMVLGITDA